MLKQIAAIVFIFGCTSVAWFILGGTIYTRTESSDATLRGQVVSTWGAPQQQLPPSADYEERSFQTTETVEDGKKRTTRTEVKGTQSLPLEGSSIDVRLALEHRQKGLLWYATYQVAFGAEYVFRNDAGRNLEVDFRLPLPAERAIYDGLAFRLDGQPLTVVNQGKSAVARGTVPAGKTAQLSVSYKSQGLDRWNYAFGGEVTQARGFHLRMTTNFKGFNFPENTLSPTEKRETPEGWELAWNYSNLVTGFQIGLEMPQKLQPGPLAGRISFFAPVSLFFFFFLLFIITTLRNIELHPMNYFFLAAAFFAFHLLMAYLVDHISVHAAFVICSLVSVFLVVSYLRLVVGLRFAAVEAGISQLIYLVLFSYAFFFQGFTGLSVTIGAILTLFVIMQMTGRIRWAEKFARPMERRV